MPLRYSLAVCFLVALCGLCGCGQSDVAETVEPVEHLTVEDEKLANGQIINRLGMKMALIPAGEFQMGSPAAEQKRQPNEFQHRVRITKPFYMGVHEVTQAEYQRVMGSNSSWFSSTGKGKDKVAGQDTSRFPAERIAWDDALEFCRRLSKLEGKTYRLPTEAEWEYACRAGTSTTFHLGDELNGTAANVDGNWPYGITTKGPLLDRTTTVGSYAPNAFGLHDMHGNVSELCSDWLGEDYYAMSPGTDPQGAKTAKYRVLRGGAFSDPPEYCRSAYRGGTYPRDQGIYAGFRVVREINQQ